MLYFKNPRKTSNIDTDYKNENMFLMMFALFKILYIGIKLTINFKIH